MLVIMPHDLPRTKSYSTIDSAYLDQGGMKVEAACEERQRVVHGFDHLLQPQSAHLHAWRDVIECFCLIVPRLCKNTYMHAHRRQSPASGTGLSHRPQSPASVIGDPSLGA